MVQSLAFVPSKDVISAFELIKKNASESHFLLSYVEKNYIGVLKKDKNCPARFPIELWNLYDRVKK